MASKPKTINTPDLDVAKALCEDFPAGSKAEHGFLFNLAEYIGESEHAGWDGFTQRELVAIRKFITDVVIYIQNK